MEKMLRLVLVSVLAVSLMAVSFGCSQKKVDTAADSAGADAAAQAARGEGMATKEESLDSKGKTDDMKGYAVLEGRTSAPLLPVYFDFDKSNIRPDQVERIKKNAAFLSANPMVRVRIEGNCDERGTDEYNMALGERRAQSAQKYLENLGVARDRMVTISYGEEKPLLYGHDEMSWAQNRRDDFVISN